MCSWPGSTSKIVQLPIFENSMHSTELGCIYDLTKYETFCIHSFKNLLLKCSNLLCQSQYEYSKYNRDVYIR